jgi:hypothetical protein
MSVSGLAGELSDYDGNNFTVDTEETPKEVTLPELSDYDGCDFVAAASAIEGQNQLKSENYGLRVDLSSVENRR